MDNINEVTQSIHALPVTIPSSVTNTNTKAWYCYILRNKQSEFRNLTYNGSTNDPKRRLRQHNGEISGGARFTSSTHGGWEIYAIMTGFVDHKNTLSCEWRIKHTNGKPGARPANHRGVLGRIRGLNEIVRLPRWTNQCTIQNHEVKYTVYLAEDVFPHFDMNGMPENIQVISGIPTF